MRVDTCSPNYDVRGDEGRPRPAASARSAPAARSSTRRSRLCEDSSWSRSRCARWPRRSASCRPRSTGTSTPSSRSGWRWSTSRSSRCGRCCATSAAATPRPGPRGHRRPLGRDARRARAPAALPLPVHRARARRRSARRSARRSGTRSSSASASSPPTWPGCPAPTRWSAEDLRVLSNLIVTAMVATAEQIMVAAGPARRREADRRDTPAPSSAWSSSARSTGSRAPESGSRPAPLTVPAAPSSGLLTRHAPPGSGRAAGPPVPCEGVAMAEQPDEVGGTSSVTRRTVLGAGLAGGPAIGAGALEPAAAARRPSRAARGTTLARTLLRGTPGAGWLPQDRRRPRRAAPASPRAPDAPAEAPRRRGRAAPLIALGQLTDMHILDAQSPARVEFLDRLQRPRLAVRPVPAVPELLPRPGDAHAARRRRDGPGAAQGPARSGDRAAPVVLDHHRRQRRQHPAQRAALADRPARRRSRSGRTRAT